MRHFYFRLAFGVLWLIVAIIRAVTANFPFMALYILVSFVFFYSAYSIWKKEKDNRR